MTAIPTVLDFWCAEHLGAFLGRWPVFDVAVQSGIHHNVLGGFGLGLIGFWTAQQVGERLPPMWRVALGRSDFLPRARQVVVFVWILEVAIEFRDASWLMRVAHTAWQHLPHL